MRYSRRVDIDARIVRAAELMRMTTPVLLRLRRSLPLLILAVAAHGLAQAQTVIYKCVDENGRVEFTDTSKRGCKVLDLPGFITAPPPRRAAPARQPSAPPAPSVSPADFPRVDAAQQRARDDDRRAILEDELQSEEKKLADLKRDFNNGEPERQGNERNYAKYQARVAQMRDDISRSERNIDALKREIATIR
jgi:hypothetical protein